MGGERPADARPGPDLLRVLRGDLRRVAVPANAPAMKAYMKSAMPFLGVSAPDLRRVCRRVFSGLVFPGPAAWRRTSLGLWRNARHREERYAAIELTGVRQARSFQDMAALPMYEEMVVSGAWWDYVDWIAKHRLGGLLRLWPRPMRRTMLDWSRSDDLWKRRSAILCQLGFKEETDLDLLYDCLEPSLSSREFFLQKAIGWALRQHAWTDPQEVRRYVRAHQGRLQPLSRREAMKNL